MTAWLIFHDESCLYDLGQLELLSYGNLRRGHTGPNRELVSNFCSGSNKREEQLRRRLRRAAFKTDITV